MPRRSPTPFTGLSAQLVDELVELRRAQRIDLARVLKEEPALDAGACWLVAGQLAEQHDWLNRGGCYVDEDDSHYSHEWNVLPDGRILDATADQFGEPAPGIRVTAADDPRYDDECDCDGAGPIDDDAWG